MNNKNKISELKELRKTMGTAPEVAPPFETMFYRGVEGIQVDLIDGPVNPYKAMYAMAVSTWGRVGSKAIDRWNLVSPNARVAVVRAVLDGHALPLAMEAPKFTFEISNLSRWAFDQIVRARVGVVYASMGTRDNCHLDLPFRMHEATWNDSVKRMMFATNAKLAKDNYRAVVESGKGNWQEARSWLPISVVHRFTMSLNYSALSNLCSRRMSFSEAEDTVAVAWLLRDRLMKQDAYPLLGSYLRPACDFAGSCRYHRNSRMSEAFGCLFRSCWRNSVKDTLWNPKPDGEYAVFNESCSNRETIAEQLGIEIPTAKEERPENFELTTRDRELFGFDPIDTIHDHHFWCTSSGRFVEPREVR